MAESRNNLKISSPGQIGRIVIGFDVPEGVSIVEESIEITSNIPAYLYGENAIVNETVETIDRNPYAIGHAIVFSMVCLSGVAQAGRNDPPYKLLITYATNQTDRDNDLLTYSKEVDVYPAGLPIP